MSPASQRLSRASEDERPLRFLEGLIDFSPDIVSRGGMSWSSAMHRAASLSLAVAIGWTASNMWMNCSRQASQTFPHRAPSNPWQDDECFPELTKPFSQAL